MSERPQDTAATFCATLVDEWVRCGVAHAVISPGSRSTPLALALTGDARLTVHVHHDERSAGFLAIGLGLATGEPAVVLTTSGTAAVEVHPAVVEADLAGVPLLVCTADRPPELVDVGAPQAIDQTHLYGRAVRWFHAPGVAEGSARSGWRPLASRAYAAATGERPGPVHLNLAFREPLLGTPGDLPPSRASETASWTWRPGHAPPAEPVISAGQDLAGRRGVLVAGPGSGSGPALDELARCLGWPVLAAPQAPVWSMDGATVRAADALLRVPEVAEALGPELVVHLGGPLASRVVGEWLAASDAVQIVAAGAGRWVDPHGTATVVLDVDPGTLVDVWRCELAGCEPVDGGAWRARWDQLGMTAGAAIDGVLADAEDVTEPGVAQALVDALPAGAALVASSSMPIRDLEWYVRPRREIEVLANRGANGIDGVVSTAIGVALGADRPGALLIGDVAFLHDSNGLLGAPDRALDLVIVVVDNDGGGIFSFLPQAEVVELDRFEQLYGTPHGLDLVAVARAFGVGAERVDGAADLPAALARAVHDGGLHVLVVRTDRSANRALHARLNDAVAVATSA